LRGLLGFGDINVCWLLKNFVEQGKFVFLQSKKQ